MSRITHRLGLVIAAAVVLTACGGGADTESSASEPASASESAPAGAGADEEEAAHPLTISLCGRDWSYEQAPERIVATDTPMLDLALMLGLGDRVVGYFGDVESLDPSVQDEAAELTRLGDNWPYPTLEAVLAGEPDLVLSYGYNAEAGFTADRLQREGINNFTVSEGCDDFDGVSTIGSFYDDVRTLARITGTSEAAEDLITGWEERVAAVEAAAPDGEPVRVLNTGSGDPAAPFVNGNRAVAHELITLAGGTSVFGDSEDAYLSPTWEEVVARDPQLIIESSGFGAEGLADVRAHLAGNPALSAMSAVADEHFAWIGYEEGVPGPQMFTGLEKISAAIIEASTGT